MLAGEGYECNVTIDDEDSKLIIFDNWKQVSWWRPASHIGHSVLFPSYNCSTQSLSLPCSGDLLLSKPASASSGLNILCLYLRNGGKKNKICSSSVTGK